MVSQTHGTASIFLIVAGALLTLVHIWGAIRRVQPWTEHVEIVLYAALTGADAWVMSTL